MERETGASRIFLIICVLVLIAIMVAGFQFFKLMVKQENIEDTRTQMLQIQAKAKIVLEKYHLDKENGLKGEELQDESIPEQYGISDPKGYYKWTQEVLDEVGLSEIKLEENEYYIVNYDNEEVIFSKGVLGSDGNRYYRLTELKKIEEPTEENNTETEENNETPKEENSEEPEGENNDEQRNAQTE